MAHLRVLELSGAPAALGYAHGAAHTEAIRAFAEERAALSGSGAWSERPLDRAEVLALAEACAAAHEQYAPDLMDELRGMAAATGLSLAELIIVNGFTDFVDTIYAVTRPGTADPLPADNCTAFIVPDHHTAEGRGFLGQTWDMHAGATPHVLLLRIRPADAPAALLFTVAGCIGMIGMNEHGVAVGINNLLGGDGQIGVTWPFVVRKMLQQRDADAALACLSAAPLAGAHNYLIYDRQNRGYNVEALSSVQRVTPLRADALTHTNHCLLPETQRLSRPRPLKSQQSSEQRLEWAGRLLADGRVTAADLMALTAHPHVLAVAEPPLYVETCGAAIMQPAKGRFWAVWGSPASNPYEQFAV